MSNFIVKALSTFFCVGYLPFIPGTFASIAVLFLYYLVKGDIFLYILSTLLLLSLGFFLSGKAEKIFNKKDASCIVIDEASGMLLGLMFIPYDIRSVAIAFVLFRILDILKPYPISSVEKIAGSAGVMGDDIIAGLYTNIVLQAALRLFSFRIS